MNLFRFLGALAGVTKASGNIQAFPGPNGMPQIIPHGGVLPGGDLSLFLNMFGPRLATKDELLNLMPSCTPLKTQKELDDLIARDVPGKQTVTMSWFYNNSNPEIAEVAKKYETLCQEFNDKVIPFGDNEMHLRTVAFDMIDNRQMDQRKMRAKIITDYKLANHVHDMEFVIFWGHLKNSENSKFTASGDHHDHHGLTNALTIDSQFNSMKKWFHLLTHPVSLLKNLDELVDFLSIDQYGPTIILEKVSREVSWLRDKFYHETPDVSYAEIDFQNFTTDLSPQSLDKMTKLGLDQDWWNTVEKSDFIIVKNHHAAGQQDAIEFKILKFPNPEKIILHKKDDILSLVKNQNQDQALKELQNPETQYNTYLEVIGALKLPLLVSAINAEAAFDQVLPVFFVGIQSTEEIEPFYQELQNAAAKLRGQAVFLIANTDESVPGHNVASRLLHHLNVELSDLPVLKLLTMKDRGMGMWEKDKLMCPDKDIMSSSIAIQEYLASYYRNELQICVRSEAFHDDMVLPGEAEVLVGSNFHDQVFVQDLDKDILIDAYAPWCGHCKAFEPQLRKLAELASHIPNNTLRITKIDATRNDLPGIGQLRGYPSILFFPGGSRSHPIEHRGSRSAEDLLKWISERATNKFDVGVILEARLGKNEGGEILSRKAKIRAILDEL